MAGSPFGGVQPGRCVCIAGVFVHLLFMDLFHCEPDRVGGASRCAARLVYCHRAWDCCGVSALASRWGPCEAIRCSVFAVFCLDSNALVLSTCRVSVSLRWYPCSSSILVSSSSLSCQCSCTGASGTGWTGFGTHADVSFMGVVSLSRRTPCQSMHLLRLFGVSLSRSSDCCWMNGCLAVVGG